MAGTADKAVKTVTRLARTRGALAALVTSLGVAAFIVVKDLVTIGLSLIGLPAEYVGDTGTAWLSYFGYGFLTMVVPFLLGFFLSLWIVAPVAEPLGLGHVIARSVLAVGIGSTLAFIVRSIADIIGSVSVGGSLFGNSFPGIDFGPGIPVHLGAALQGSLVQFVAVLPLGILAGILLWHWRRAHPPEYHVEGLVDV